MKFVTYTATPGLERFPELERFRVWRSTHKGLLRADREYQRRVRRYRIRSIGTTVLFVLGCIALNWSPLAVHVPAVLLLTAVYVLYTLRASFGMQSFMNERVGNALQG